MRFTHLPAKLIHRACMIGATIMLFVASANVAEGQQPVAEPSTKSQSYADAEGVANGGYDVVAYFTENRAAKGRMTFAAKFDGLTYLFASEEHRDLFVAEPKIYLPAFGGWCAFAVAAKNTKFPPDPATFKLYNGKLLLFYNGAHGNTSVPWNQNEQQNFATATQNWPGIANK